MQLWPVAHFFSFCHHFWVGATAKQQQTHTKVVTEWKKGAAGQSCICKEVTSYKIHTLVAFQVFHASITVFTERPTTSIHISFGGLDITKWDELVLATLR